MDSEQILSLYETVAEITDKMLIAARRGDWEELAELESRCSSHVDVLRKNDEVPQPLTGAIRDRKVKIIKKILSDDREIRSITEPWLAQLSALMHNASTERKLSQAYGANQS